MYPSDYTAPLLANQPNGDTRPIFFCEYAHTMGNSGGNLKDFWDQWRSTKRIIGGCIWEFKDQGLLKTDSAGVDYYAYGGDFGERYFDNFTIKGIVNADGQPKGVMYECKRIFQPIESDWKDASKNLVKIMNRGAVTNVNAYTLMLLLREDGRIVLRKSLTTPDVLPGQEATIDISPYLPRMKPGAEYHADLQFMLAQDEAWAKKGFVIASNQLQVRAVQSKVVKIAGGSKLSATEDATYLVFSGKDFSIKFSKATGALSSYIYKGTEQIKAELLPHFTRPLTDNDKRGWKPNRKLAPWYRNDLKPGKVISLPFSNETGSGQHVNSSYSLINDSAMVSLSYFIYTNGLIKVDYQLSVQAGSPNIPKVGMQVGVERSYEQVEWVGKGPMENYIDKNYGADVGLYSMPIKQFMENYVVPQENGNRTDVRWMYLNNPKTRNGLLIVADSLLSMSAWPYTEEMIQNAKHTNKLKDAGFITLNIDLIQMGVGGNDSWSDVAAPLEKYQIKAKDYQYSFYIVPFNAKNETAGERAKEIKL